jgi:hypothetical protein
MVRSPFDPDLITYAGIFANGPYIFTLALPG